MSEIVTFSFGDLDSGRSGLAVLAPDGRSAAAARFADREVPATGEPFSVAAEQRNGGWRVAVAAAGTELELDFTALGDPVELPGGTERLCSVTGTITAGGQVEPIACLGRRGSEREPGQPVLRRSLAVWFGEDEAILGRAERAAGAEAEAESLGVYLLEGAPPAATRVADPRLSTAYDAGGRQRRAGLELWVSEDDDYPRRAAGEVLGTTQFALGAWRLDSAFLHWRMHGREGAGIYDVLRPA